MRLWKSGKPLILFLHCSLGKSRFLTMTLRIKHVESVSSFQSDHGPVSNQRRGSRSSDAICGFLFVDLFIDQFTSWVYVHRPIFNYA